MLETCWDPSPGDTSEARRHPQCTRPCQPDPRHRGMTREGGTLLDILLNAGLQLDNITWIQVSGFEAETGIRGDPPEEPDIVQGKSKRNAPMIILVSS